MRAKLIIISCLVVVVVLFSGYKSSRAEALTENGNMEIGVVSVRGIFQNSKRNAQYREKAASEQNKIMGELEKLSKELEALQAGVKTLKAGSDDHLKLVKEIFEKEGGLQAKREYYKQHLELKDQQWTEELYKDILEQVTVVAEDKGLNLVFEKDEVELPAGGANELMLTIRTHKLLYSSGCPDITEDVMARVDSVK